jgi:hypothetical protein
MIFAKVHKIFFKKVLDYSCAHVLRKGTSKWALDWMGKIPKEPMENLCNSL